MGNNNSYITNMYLCKLSDRTTDKQVNFYVKSTKTDKYKYFIAGKTTYDNDVNIKEDAYYPCKVSVKIEGFNHHGQPILKYEILSIDYHVYSDEINNYVDENFGGLREAIEDNDLAEFYINNIKMLCEEHERKVDFIFDNLNLNGTNDVVKKMLLNKYFEWYKNKEYAK